VLTARELNSQIKIVSRASNDSSVKKIIAAGANNVIMPDKIGGAHMATLILSPDVNEFLDIMSTQSNESFHIEEIQSSKTITLEELDCWKKTGATILGLKTATGEYTVNPTAKTAIKPGHRLIAMGSKEQLAKATRLLG
jgi:voltage-gated potassium channel